MAGARRSWKRMPELDRRQFLKLVGTSAGAAAAAGCSDPVEKLIPYVVQPEEITPGLPVIYASTCQECSAGCGLHVRTREGRPIKLGRASCREREKRSGGKRGW